MLDEYPETQAIVAAAWQELVKAGKAPLEATAEEAYCSLVGCMRADPWSPFGRWWLYRTPEDMQEFTAFWQITQRLMAHASSSDCCQW